MTSTLPPLAQATSGSLGAVVSNALIFPLDTLTTRLQTSNKGARRPAKGGYSSISAALKTIYRTEGLAAFYSGLGPDSLSTLFSQFIYFLCYSALRDRFQARKEFKATPTASTKGKSVKLPVLSAVEELAIGCLAGVVAKGVVSPLSMITVRAQTSSEPRQDVVGGKEGDKRPVEDSDSDDDEGGFGKAPSALALAKEIYDEQGIAGFWSGFSSTVILTINPAITFYAFATLKRALIPAKHREHPTPTQTFFCGALASALASGITYPLILAKTRLQFKSPTGRSLYRSQIDVFRKTVRKQGIKGLYQGCESQLLKGFLSEGVKLVVKDRIELLIVLAHRLLVARGKIPASSSM